MKYKLKEPVEFGGQTFEECTVKEKWNAGDFIEIQNAGEGQGDRCARQIALALNWPDPQVRELSIEDYKKLIEISNDFFIKNTKSAKRNS